MVWELSQPQQCLLAILGVEQGVGQSVCMSSQYVYVYVCQVSSAEKQFSGSVFSILYKLVTMTRN